MSQLQPAIAHTSLIREMTITHDDFLRLLPKAIKPYTYQHKAGEINITVANKQQSAQIIISLGTQTIRTIGSLSLPVTQVTFHIHNLTEATKNAFFSQFDRAYHRGGG